MSGAGVGDGACVSKGVGVAVAAGLALGAADAPGAADALGEPGAVGRGAVFPALGPGCVPRGTTAHTMVAIATEPTTIAIPNLRRVATPLIRDA